MLINLFKAAKKLTMTTLQKPDVVFVLGAPGSGKGTQCSNIVKEFGFVHLSAGDLLREERKKVGSKYGELIEEHIRNGLIVPVEITCNLLEIAMNNHSSRRFLIDGFPRNQNNMDGWNAQMSDKTNVKFVLFFECSKEVCTQRCLSRGAAGSGRTDDNLESLEKRFNTYLKETMPIIKHFEEKNMVHCVNADKTVPEVFEEVKAIFSKCYPQ